MNPSSTDKFILLQRLFIVATAVVIGACGYIAVQTIQIVETTSKLHVRSSNSQAVISISQPNHEAKVIGVGEATIRLKPGSYQLSGSYAGNQTESLVRIRKGKTTSSFLENRGKPKLPSVNNIHFTNIDALINSGVNSTQIGVLKHAFFQYKKLTNTVVLDPASVQPAPRDPKTAVGFTINFSVKIDNTSYNASVSYADLSNIRLYLYDTKTISLVFDSYAVSGADAE